MSCRKISVLVSLFLCVAWSCCALAGPADTPAGQPAPANQSAPAGQPAPTGQAVSAEQPAHAGEAAPQCADAEVKAEVPALSAFHEVIYPLWHEAWPSKNLDQMRELLPQVMEHVVAVQKADLPGILRDKQAKWDEGIAAVAADAGRLEKALAANEQQAALDAVESLHAGFEGLVRTIRPRLKELDAYHQVLYRVYHYDWPQKDFATLKTHAGDLAARCGELQAAAVPKRFAAKEEQLRAGFTALCAATSELGTAMAGTETGVIGAAVEKVHSNYQACERLFD